jgi:hypothetical protein
MGEFVLGAADAIGRTGTLLTGIVLIVGSLWWSGTVPRFPAFWFELFIGIALVALTFVRASPGMGSFAEVFVLAAFLLAIGNALWSLKRVLENSADEPELAFSITIAVFVSCTTLARLFKKSRPDSK